MLSPAGLCRPQHNADPRAASKSDLERRRHGPAYAPLYVDNDREIRPQSRIAVGVGNAEASSERKPERRFAKWVEQKSADHVYPSARPGRLITPRRARGRVDPQANVDAQRDRCARAELRRRSPPDDRVRTVLGVGRRLVLRACTRAPKQAEAEREPGHGKCTRDDRSVHWARARQRA